MPPRVLVSWLMLVPIWLALGPVLERGGAVDGVAYAEAADGSAQGSKSAAKKGAAKKKAKKQRAKKKATKKRATKKQTKKRAKQRRAKKRRAKQRAAKKRRARKRSNMPRGWQWPPSEAMEKEGARCLAHLTELGVRWQRVERTRKVATAIVVPDMVFGRIRLEPTFRKPPFVMDCLLAEALTEHSQVLYDQGVRVLRFSSIHSYRKARANGVTSGSLSRHALGLAVDVYEMTMEGGETLIVAKDYRRSGRVLPGVEDAINGTGGFRTVLSPGNDRRSHHDHFHIAARMPRP